MLRYTVLYRILYSVYRGYDLCGVFYEVFYRVFQMVFYEVYIYIVYIGGALFSGRYSIEYYIGYFFF